MCEIYQLYASRDDMIQLLKNLIHYLNNQIHKIDSELIFDTIHCADLVKQYYNIDINNTDVGLYF